MRMRMNKKVEMEVTEEMEIEETEEMEMEETEKTRMEEMDTGMGIMELKALSIDPAGSEKRETVSISVRENVHRIETKSYCPRNEIQKMETELWNLTVKGNDLTAYTQGFRDDLLCTRMVPNEEDIVERFIGKKVQGYAARSAENKRRTESNLRDNHGQQLPYKRKNTSGQNVARAYTAGNNKKKDMAGTLPICNIVQLATMKGCVL
ncbi:hypothetical protein Tco_0846481 [Tanacetum coccineum]